MTGGRWKCLLPTKLRTCVDVSGLCARVRGCVQGGARWGRKEVTYLGRNPVMGQVTEAHALGTLGGLVQCSGEHPVWGDAVRRSDAWASCREASCLH